jgi:hypothetical protein
MRLLHIGIALALATAGFADTITLKSGRVINGTYLGGTPRTIKMEVGDRIETLDISDVSRVEFGGVSATVSDEDRRPSIRRSESSDNSNNDRPVLRRADGSSGGNVVFRPDPNTRSAQAPVRRGLVELPAGTNIVVRMIEGVDSDTARVGQTFSASIDEQITGPNGEVVIPRGTDAVVKLVDSKESGKFTGRSELTLDLQSVKIDGQSVDINTQTVSRESSSRGERTAKVAGGTAAVGAIIGAIAGGGKGAAIGGVAGGAAGAGAEAVTKGQRVKVPSETRLTFVLDTPLKI